MINQGYPFSKVGYREFNQNCYLKLHKFKFKNKFGQVYNTVVEEYCNKIYIIKFHLAIHKSHPNKYKYIVNNRDPFRVIRTSFDIALKILEDSPTASFGFIGCQSEKKPNEKNQVNTQRFRIYKYITSNYFGYLGFTHSTSKEHSAYLLINNFHKDVAKFNSEAIDIFKNIYPTLDGL